MNGRGGLLLVHGTCGTCPTGVLATAQQGNGRQDRGRQGQVSDRIHDRWASLEIRGQGADRVQQQGTANQDESIRQVSAEHRP